MAAGELRDGLSGGGVQEIIELAGASPDLSVRLAHAGVLVEDRSRWRFAIPSLRRHVLWTKDPLPAPLAAALEEILVSRR